MTNILRQEDIPELISTPTSTFIETQAFQKPKPIKLKKKPRLPTSKIKKIAEEVKHDPKPLGKKEIKQMVRNLPINKLGPSLLPFAVPEKFLSPYKIYKKVRLEEIKTKNELNNLPLRDKIRQISREWGALQKCDKKLYFQMARACKEEYINKMSGQRMPKLRGGRGKSTRDKTKPDPINTPFRAFVKENEKLLLDENPGYDYYDLKRLMEDIWDVFDEEQKAHYENLAKEDKWRFIEQWEIWLRQRFASEDPIEPEKFPQLPQRAKTGFNIFSELKKKEFMNLLPETQQHEIAGLVHKLWNQISTEDRQYFEEEAQEDQERFKREMEEYNKATIGRIKRSDEISKQFVQKLKALEDNAIIDIDKDEKAEEEDEMYLSVKKQTLFQIINSNKEAVKLIKQSRKEEKEKLKAELNKNKRKRPKLLKQRTLYSQVEEMKERVDAEKKSYRSEQVKTKKKRGKKLQGDSAFHPFDQEEDYLLTHLSEVIAQNKKQIQQLTNPTIVTIEEEKPVSVCIVDTRSEEERAKESQIEFEKQIMKEIIEKQKDTDEFIKENLTISTDEASSRMGGQFTQNMYENYLSMENKQQYQEYEKQDFEDRIDLHDFIDDPFTQIDDDVIIVEGL